MPLSPDQLAKSREILLEKRAMLANQVEILQKEAADSTEATENSKSPISSAENASDAFDQDFAFMSMESASFAPSGFSDTTSFARRASVQCRLSSFQSIEEIQIPTLRACVRTTHR